MKDLSTTIIENLRKIIAARNLKQATVGDYADISESQFSRVLNGTVQLSICQLANIASGLGMRAIDIITYPDIYEKKDASHIHEEPEVVLQMRLSKAKKDQVLKLVFGENNIEILNR